MAYDGEGNPPGYYNTIERPNPGGAMAEPMGPRGRLVAKMIGADQAKFRVICRAWIYGGAFHSILDETLAGKLRQILTLLAPALAGTLLGLVG